MTPLSRKYVRGRRYGLTTHFKIQNIPLDIEDHDLQHFRMSLEQSKNSRIKTIFPTHADSNSVFKPIFECVINYRL